MGVPDTHTKKTLQLPALL